jgi:hypothetical protein
MTGYISLGANPMSIMTVKSIQDLGYTVDLNQADPTYVLPSATGRRLRGENILKMEGDVILQPTTFDDANLFPYNEQGEPTLPSTNLQELLNSTVSIFANPMN